MKRVVVCLLVLMPFAALASEKDTIREEKKPYHRNVIKFNPTPMILWSAKNLTFSYERILNPRQSISIELGYLELPQLFADTLIDLVDITSGEKRGINATLEYRFYLTRLNARPVPAGLYIGPYLTYYGYEFKNGLDIMNPGDTTNGSLKGDYWSVNLGFELGYQFVFWKRLTLDLVLVGPSVSYYGGEATISGNLNAEQIKAINEELYNKLVEKYPGVQYFSLDKTFEETGKLDLFHWGFRYLLQIGFHF